MPQATDVVSTSVVELTQMGAGGRVKNNGPEPVWVGCNAQGIVNLSTDVTQGNCGWELSPGESVDIPGGNQYVYVVTAEGTSYVSWMY